MIALAMTQLLKVGLVLFLPAAIGFVIWGIVAAVREAKQRAGLRQRAAADRAGRVSRRPENVSPPGKEVTSHSNK